MNIKEIQSLTTTKGRVEHGLCLVEGAKLVNEHRGRATQIFQRGNAPAVIFNKIAAFDTDIIATVPIPVSTEHTTPFLILDRIQDPGNLGTILRTASAFNFNTIYLIDCADPWSQKSIRSAMGAQFHLNIHKYNPDHIKGSTIYIADLNGTPLSAIKPTAPFGIIMGNEGRGVSAELKRLPHQVVTIPIKNVESLNVAVAGGIIMHSFIWGLSPPNPREPNA